jgi:site-specific recombinase XerD
MSACSVVRTASATCPFLVIGVQGRPLTEANTFLQYLGACGRSRYTLLAYARGLAHFFSWLHARQIAIDAVTRTTVQDYISDFAGSPKGGACPPSPAHVGQMDLKTRQASPSLTRQPATLNHRVSVLAAFYAYLSYSSTSLTRTSLTA